MRLFLSNEYFISQNIIFLIHFFKMNFQIIKCLIKNIAQKTNFIGRIQFN